MLLIDDVDIENEMGSAEFPSDNASRSLLPENAQDDGDGSDNDDTGLRLAAYALDDVNGEALLPIGTYIGGGDDDADDDVDGDDDGDDVLGLTWCARDGPGPNGREVEECRRDGSVVTDG